MPCHLPSGRKALPLLAAVGAGTGLFMTAPTRAADVEAALLPSARTALLDDARQIRATVIRQTLAVAGGHSQDDGLWTSTWGRWGDHDARLQPMRSNGGGAVGAVERDLGDVRVGALVGAHTLSASTATGNLRGSGSVVGAYVYTEQGAWQWQGGVTYSTTQIESHRRTAAGRPFGRYDGSTTQAWADAGYALPVRHGNVTPFASLARAQLSQQGVRETNATDAWNVAPTRGHVDIGTIGVRSSLQFGNDVQAYGMLGYQQAWGDDLRPVDHVRSAAGDAPFDAIGVPTPRRAAVAEAGVHFATSQGTSIDASYRGLFGSGTHDQGLRLSVTLRW
jgi:outer membrane autotransporter protein